LAFVYHAAASMDSARAARRKVTDRLISRFASAQSPLPRSRAHWWRDDAHETSQDGRG
jgi:hypothetical protein